MPAPAAPPEPLPPQLALQPPPQAAPRPPPQAAVVEPAATLAQLRAGALTGCVRLDLRGCGLDALPPEVLGLADALEVLDLSDNALSTLPPWLARLGRLRILFCSNNRFSVLPPVLGQCPALDTVGFKANQIAQVPAQALPPTLRWLILTDNRIAALPAALTGCTRLQKLMLAGNRLQRWPQGMAALQRLELLRLSANAFDSADAALPMDLLALPRLAWLAYGGNPFVLPLEQAAEQAARAQGLLPDIAWPQLQLRALLGEGASGRIHGAQWQRPGAAAQAVALKLFKGELTSDGLPRSEMAACIAAGQHPQLAGAIGRLVGHPEALQGLVLPLLPAAFRPLAEPPSMASCSRDVYAAGLQLAPACAQAIAQAVQAALTHLHSQGVLHGDLYGHNTLVTEAGDARLSDFGAASFLLPTDDLRHAALRRLDWRAYGVLVDELAAHCAQPELLAPWQALAQTQTQNQTQTQTQNQNQNPDQPLAEAGPRP